jgi:hypothetical protein
MDPLTKKRWQFDFPFFEWSLLVTNLISYNTGEENIPNVKRSSG